MTRFRPCIDLHSGQVKQIVGGTLSNIESSLQTNHVSQHSAGYFARLYKQQELEGAHIIMLGPGNEEAAREALAEWPGEFQIGGGITEANAQQWLNWGAGKGVVKAIGDQRDKLVIDLSCRRKGDTWFVAMNKWQTMTDFEMSRDSIKILEPYCSEFLVHAADNEGLQQGIDEELVQKLAQWCEIPVTYAGGSRSVDDLRRVEELSDGKVDLTIGSALDVFGGSGVKFEDCVEWNKSKDH